MASLSSELPHCVPPLHPAYVGQGMALSSCCGAGQVSYLSLSGAQSRNGVLLWWVGAVVCEMLHGLNGKTQLVWEAGSPPV